MADATRNDAETGAEVAALQRQVRVLEKKFARSEQNRVALEDAKDRFDVLYQKTVGELDEQKELVDEKKRQAGKPVAQAVKIPRATDLPLYLYK